jgi:hypothetical protein
METTADLLSKALSVKRASRWSEELDIDVSTIAQAKKRGHLSPVIAGALAEKLGENVSQWIIIAALESERDSAPKRHLMTMSTIWKKAANNMVNL